MTALCADSFDRYNGIGPNVGLQSKWSAVGTPNLSTSMVAGRFGGQAMQLAGANTTRLWQRTFAAQSTLTFGFALNMSVATTFQGNIAVLSSAGTTMCGIALNGANKLVAALQTSTAAFTALGIAANALPISNWYWIDVECTISDTVGVLNIYVDGDTTTYGVAATGVDTRNGAPTTVDSIGLGFATASAGSSTLATSKFDDLIISDSATRLGPRKGFIQYPSADVLQGFSRSSGAANFSLVNEATPDSDTSYVQGGLGALDRYDFDNMSFNPSTIDLVQPYAFMESTDVYPRQCALQVKSGATVDDGASFNMGSLAYGCAERLMVTDPNTSAAWTKSAIDAIQGGPKVTF